MRRFPHLALAAAVAATVLCGGCEQQPPLKDEPLAEVHQRFIKLIRGEYSYTKAKVFIEGQTVYLYVPGERSLFTYKAGSPSGPSFPPYSVQFIDARYKDGIFTVEYDIIPATKVAGSQGLSTGYTEAFSREYQNVYSAIGRIYLDNQERPEFVVHVSADVGSGSEVVNIYYIKDVIQYMSGSLPQEEYQLRVISKTQGDTAIIGDWEGRHLEPREWDLPDFLAEQIVKRVRFKFQQSDFPPDGSPQEEILAICARTIGYYDFRDFSYIKMMDLRGGKVTMVSRQDLPPVAP